MLCRVLEHYGLEVILVTMSRAGVLLVRRGDPAEPLPRKGALRSNNRRYQRKTDNLQDQCCGAGPFLTGSGFFLTGSSSYKKYR